MAKIINPYKMEFSGKLGDKIGVCGKYGHYVRSVSKKGPKPPTVLQQAVRLRFSVAVSFLAPLRELLESIGWNGNNKKMGAYNRAVSETIKTAVDGQFPDFYINYEKVCLSRGSLLSPMAVAAKVENDGRLRLSWCPCDDGGLGFSSDVPVVVLFDPDACRHQVEWPAARRKDGQLVVCPYDRNFRRLHVWLFFVSRGGRKASRSKYIVVEGGLAL